MLYTLSERVDGVAGGQVGAGDKVLTVGRLNLDPRPALEVAVETAHLTRGEGDVGHAALAVIPWENKHTGDDVQAQARTDKLLDEWTRPYAHIRST